MYTVIRFFGAAEQRDELEALGHAINERRPGMFERLAKRGHGFACSICDEDVWSAHLREIRAALEEFREIVERAVAIGIRVSFDTAIHPGEHKPPSGVRIVEIAIPPELMVIAGEAGVMMMTSMYVIADDRDDRRARSPRA